MQKLETQKRDEEVARRVQQEENDRIKAAKDKLIQQEDMIIQLS